MQLARFFNSDVIRTAALPIQPTGPKKFLAWYPLGDLQQNDLIQINASAQVSNPYAFPVMFGAYLTLASGGVLFTNAISAAMTGNVTQDMHHDTRAIPMAYYMPAAMNNAYLALVGYANAYGGTGNMAVDAVKLSGFVLRP